MPKVSAAKLLKQKDQKINELQIAVDMYSHKFRYYHDLYINESEQWERLKHGSIELLNEKTKLESKLKTINPLIDNLKYEYEKLQHRYNDLEKRYCEIVEENKLLFRILDSQRK